MDYAFRAERIFIRKVLRFAGGRQSGWWGFTKPPGELIFMGIIYQLGKELLIKRLRRQDTWQDGLAKT